MRISMYQTHDSVNNALYVKAILDQVMEAHSGAFRSIPVIIRTASFPCKSMIPHDSRLTKGVSTRSEVKQFEPVFTG